MTPAWAQRQEALMRDCIVSPDVFDPIVERLRDFAVPYQHTLETQAGKRNMYLYLAGLLSHLARKNAKEIATQLETAHYGYSQTLTGCRAFPGSPESRRPGSAIRPFGLQC